MAAAIRSSASTLMFRFARSTIEMYVRCSAARSASCSCEYPDLSRALRIAPASERESTATPQALARRD